MTKIDRLVQVMGTSPGAVSFTDLCKVCEFYFGPAHQSATSHRVFKTPWQGNPRVNIQNDKGSAKAYQVRQVLKAIEQLEVNNESREN